MAQEPQRLLTVDEAAVALRKNATTVRRWLSQGGILDAVQPAGRNGHWLIRADADGTPRFLGRGGKAA
jgi:excisionase family DNA binding protein